MKIAMITTDFLPNIGGVTQHVIEIAKALRAQNEEVEVIAPIYSADWRSLSKQPYEELPDGIPTWRIPLVLNTSIRFVTGQISFRLSDKRLRRELLSRLQRIQPDVVHWHALESLSHPLASWTRSARVWTNHTSYFITGIAGTRRMYYRAEAEQADEIIAPSEELCDLTAGLGIDRRRIHFIPNGVDPNRFRPDVGVNMWRERLQLSQGERLILCPRRLEKKNGVSYFIKAAISLLNHGIRDIKFAVAGNFVGPRAESEESVVASLVAQSGFGEYFQMLGRIENNDMPGLYAASTMVVIPSLMEATSLSAMEAMAAAKPIVCTNVGGLPFLVRNNENGILVPPRDDQQLTVAMTRLLDSPSKSAEFGRNGRSRIKSELDWTMIAERTRTIYQLAIARHRQTRRSTETAVVV